ncbi:hypothetical protein [Actinoplanes friuliensis]|jgi:hypothetical protein|uniref:Uncharacterized protein n=1 Tax=Actinoplanes friuliensis DSM 7358 TaxID=1246995 RepID=U5VNP0_9ACTN|nr:hypothetical protein [Actinoplanes friuliensis]AGZ38417.1 hypothetical protein AFR_00640 [Actinoplanes friuliensis DSM 7358]
MTFLFALGFLAVVGLAIWISRRTTGGRSSRSGTSYMHTGSSNQDGNSGGYDYGDSHHHDSGGDSGGGDSGGGGGGGGD